MIACVRLEAIKIDYDKTSHSIWICAENLSEILLSLYRCNLWTIHNMYRRSAVGFT